MSETNNNQKSSKGKEEPDRGNWDNQCDFFLSCLGYAVGLGNVWRFPILCFRHGGGSFLVAYSLMLAFAGLPIFFMELAIGQYGGLGPNKLFGRMVPALKGLGYGMLVIMFLVSIYYNMIIAWTIYYTFAGFTSQLPWQYCGNDYNSPTCFHKEMAENCTAGSEGLVSYYNNTCTRVAEICNDHGLQHTASNLDSHNFTMCNNGTHDVPLEKVYTRRSPSEDYFERVVLGYNEDTSWENYGSLRWELVLCLLMAWVIVGLSLIKGVKSSGKVVYFTALFPYLVLVILLVKGATLEGAAEGIKFYITPKFENLLGIQIWSDAATQIFYSLGAAFGGLITLASYNKFSNNCHRDAILISFANCGTSVFAGFVIFSIIGFMAHESGQEVSDVVAGGPGLAFVAYPEAVTKLPVSPLWSFLFFTMLITLGLDSQFTGVETLITAMMDEWPSLRKRKASVVLGMCVIFFVLGLPLCANGGVLMFTLIDWFCSSWSLLLIAIIEVVFITYAYGHEKLFANIAEMGIRMPYVMHYYWRLNWQLMTPLILLFITFVTWIKFTPAEYNAYVFPPPYQAMGWLMASVSVLTVVAGAVWEVVRRKRNGLPTDWRSMTTPVAEWGPAEGGLGISSSVIDQRKAEAAYHNDAFNNSLNQKF